MNDRAAAREGKAAFCHVDCASLLFRKRVADRAVAGDDHGAICDQHRATAGTRTAVCEPHRMDLEPSATLHLKQARAVFRVEGRASAV
eukprot:5382179-Prymnesium_polylepis.1